MKTLVLAMRPINVIGGAFVVFVGLKFNVWSLVGKGAILILFGLYVVPLLARQYK